MYSSNSTFCVEGIYCREAINVDDLPETDFEEVSRIGNNKSASVYECFPFILPYNALSALLKELRRSRP
jgi:hypothetical protein